MTNYDTVKGYENFFNQVYGGQAFTIVLNEYKNTTGDWVLYTNPLYSEFCMGYQIELSSITSEFSL